ncbi:MAG: hypothetical protein V4629_02895 [Pseudomonadota bacterium]
MSVSSVIEQARTIINELPQQFAKQSIISHVSRLTNPINNLRSPPSTLNKRIDSIKETPFSKRVRTTAKDAVRNGNIAHINGDTGLTDKGKAIHSRCWMKTPDAGLILKTCADNPKAKQYLENSVRKLIETHYHPSQQKEVFETILKGIDLACANPSNLTLNKQGYLAPEVEQSSEMITRLFHMNDLKASNIMDKNDGGTDDMMRCKVSFLLGEYAPPFVLITNMKGKWQFFDEHRNLKDEMNINPTVPIIIHTEKINKKGEKEGHFELLIPKGCNLKPTDVIYSHQLELPSNTLPCPLSMLNFPNLNDLNNKDKSDDQKSTSSVLNQQLEHFLQHQREKLIEEQSSSRL